MLSDYPAEIPRKTLLKGARLALCIAVLWPLAARPQSAAEVIEAVYIGPGVSCAQVELVSARQIISLKAPLPSDIAPGTALRLTGRFVAMSICMQGRTFVAEAVALSPSPGGD